MKPFVVHTTHLSRETNITNHYRFRDLPCNGLTSFPHTSSIKCCEEESPFILVTAGFSWFGC